jgi:carbamoyl-phosphate synthase large subunit
MKRVLITSAGSHSAAAFNRSLKNSPEPAYLIGTDSDKLTLQRAEADEKHLLPHVDEPDFLAVLRDLISETSPDVVFTLSPEETLAVSGARDTLSAKVFLPPHEYVSTCQLEWESYKKWQQAGVPVAQSLLIQNESDLRRAFQEIGPKLWLREMTSRQGKGSLPVWGFEPARDWINLRRGWGNFIAADLLGKKTVTWESVWRNGDLVAAQGRRRRSWELHNLVPSGVTGITGSSETASDPEIDDIAVRAINAIGPHPHGVLCVDLTYDMEGRPNVTKISAGSFMDGGAACFSTLGFNMPACALRTATEEPLDGPFPVLNPLPQGVICIRGMDIEPVFSDSAEIERMSNELSSLRAEIRDVRHGVPVQRNTE